MVFRCEIMVAHIFTMRLPVSNCRILGKVKLSSTFCGSAAYAAPEIIQGKMYDPRKHDSWSLGVILYIMVCGSMPYDDSNVRKMLKEQLRQR